MAEKAAATKKAPVFLADLSERPSEGKLLIEDTPDGGAILALEVRGLGVLTLRAKKPQGKPLEFAGVALYSREQVQFTDKDADLLTRPVGDYAVAGEPLGSPPRNR